MTETPSRTATVIVASSRAAIGARDDTTGPLITQWLETRDFTVTGPVVVPDGAHVGTAIAAAVRRAATLILTTGGTGLTPTDRTPEFTAPELDTQIPGLADAIRRAGLPGVPTAVLSRGLAGIAGSSLVVNLPGSSGGVRDGLGVLDEVLDHALEQIRGGDHA